MWWLSLPHSAMEINVPVLKIQINEHQESAGEQGIGGLDDFKGKETKTMLC